MIVKMKSKILIVAALASTIVTIGQKDELKAADKAFKKGDAVAAQKSLDEAAALIPTADAKMQAQYYFTRGRVNNDLAKKGNNDAYEEAVSSFQKVLEVEEASGKAKYSAETQQYITKLTADLVNSAVEDNQKESYKTAAKKLYMGYTLSPKDTIYLYYAASSAVNGGHYEEALTYYNKLQKLGYDGRSVLYRATNVETGKVEEMQKDQRDLMVKSGKYTTPVDEQTPSRKAEIVKNTALIYTQLGQDDKALGAYQAARENDPEDVNLILNEANLYFKQGDKEKFKSLMAEAIALAPNNPDLYYNVGVINGEQGNIKEAREAYKKALEINPSFTNAYLNLSTTYVNEGNSLIDAMNALGNSRADIKKYDELKAKKDGLFTSGSEVLEKALKMNPDNQGILTQLKNIYGAMGDNDNFLRMKKLLGE